ncbi:MAG: hypothetical protein R6V44_01695 [Paracoccaceae bacterium]
MGRRGPKSAADAVALRGPLAARRPEPPAGLRDEAAEIWRQTVDALPADWLEPGALPVLESYARQAVALRRLAMLMEAAEAAEPFDVEEFRDAVKAHSAAAQVLKTLGTSLRLTPQTRLRAAAAGARATNAPGGRRPWDEDDPTAEFFAS